MEAGEMLYIPAFCWHQVTSVEESVSINVFFGDSPASAPAKSLAASTASSPSPSPSPLQPPSSSPSPFADKVLHRCSPACLFWVTNIIEQTLRVQHFPVEALLRHFDDAVVTFLRTQWAAEPLDAARHLRPLRRHVQHV